MEKTIVVGHVIIPQDQRMAIIQETVAQKFVAMPDLGVTVLIEYWLWGWLLQRMLQQLHSTL